MHVEVIDDQEPRGLRIGGDGASNMRRKVFLGSARADGRRHNFPRRPVEVSDQALRPMAEVCILGTLAEAGLHGQGGGGPLQRLYPSFFLCTADVTSLLGHGWRWL